MQLGGYSKNSPLVRTRSFSYDGLSQLMTASNSESGTVSYTYYPNGQVNTRTDARSIITTYTYDGLNRLKSRSYTNDPSHTPQVTMTYDSITGGVNTKGRLVSEMTGPTGSPLTSRQIFSPDSMGRVKQEMQCTPGACSTSGNTINYDYDFAGDVQHESNGVNADPITFAYTYDQDDRLQTVTSSLTEDAQHPNTLFNATSYGALGLLGATIGGNTQAQTTAITETRSYDNRGRLISLTDTGHPFAIPTAEVSGAEKTYQVCTSGGTSCRTLADSGTVTVVVDGFSASANYGSGSTASSVASALAAALNGTGSPVSASLSGTTITLSGASSYTMSTTGTINEGGCNKACHSTPDFTVTLTGGSSTGTIYSFAMSTPSGGGYAQNGNVTGFADLIQGTWNLHYDHLNRLNTGSASAGPYSGLNFTWAYDPFGNRESQIASGSSQQSFQSTPTFTFSSGTNRVDNGNYDASGNLLSDSLTSYVYDAEGRVCVSQSAGGMGGATGYLYDAESRRVAKGTVASSSCDFTTNTISSPTIYILDQAGNQLSEVNGTNWRHTNLFAGGRVMATIDIQGMHFNLGDWLGTKRVQASAGGSVEETCLSLSFGDSLFCVGSDATEHHFTGKERDSESGNDYFGARYYGSLMGRFLSPDWSPDPDPVPYADLRNPQTLNLYSYVENNPLSNKDDDGHSCDQGTIGPDGTLTFHCQNDPQPNLFLMGAGVVFANEELGPAAWGVGGLLLGVGSIQACIQTHCGQAIANLFSNENNTPPAPPATVPPNTASPNPDENNEKVGAQDKKLSSQEVENLEKNTGQDAHEIKSDALGTNKNISKYDLYKNSDGEIVVKPKGSSGAGEPTGYTTEHLKTPQE